MSGARLLLAAGAGMLALAWFASPSDALPNARWRCKMSGDIPMGTLTVSGTSYRFSVAKNSLWDEKPGDAGNGSGEFSATADTMTPLSGPLATHYGVSGQIAPGTDGSPVIFFAERGASAALFGCWQG